MKKLIPSFFCLLLISLGGCKPQENGKKDLTLDENMPTLTFSEKNNKEKIHLKIGEIIKIELMENPTTGYQWEVDSFNKGIVALKRNQYMLSEQPRPGESGYRLVEFEVIQSGTTRIKLIKKRPWKAKGAAIDRFEMEISAAE